MKTNFLLIFLISIFLISCQSEKNQEVGETGTANSLDPIEQKITIQTPKGEFQVYTKRLGNNPKKKVLLLHGGPGMTHEQYGNFDAYFPQEDIEIIWYDQLGSYHSDQPKDSTLWTIERFVDEVEQVRVALGLSKDNFYLFGQSWGGMLAIEYALAHPQNIKGLIISNMMSSLDDYEKYAKEVLGAQMPKEVLAELMTIEQNNDFENPRFMELLNAHHYPYHVLRKPMQEWPEDAQKTLAHVNPDVYVRMQGYSEFGITPGATLKGWSRTEDLKNIKVPTLIIGATHDTMDPQHLEWMSKEVQNGRFLLCPNGSHLSQYDDPEHFFPGLIQFIHQVDQGTF